MLVRSYPPHSKRREKTKPVPGRKCFGAIITLVAFGEVPVVVGISNPCGNALVPEWDRIDKVGGKSIHFICLIIQYHSTDITFSKLIIIVDSCFCIKLPVAPIASVITEKIGANPCLLKNKVAGGITSRCQVSI